MPAYWSSSVRRAFPPELLRGRVALVTGGASGIGRATAQLLAAAGATVVVADLDGSAARATRATLTPRRRHLALTVDVADEASVRQGFARVLEDLGRLDTVVHSAGTWRPGDDGPIDEVSLHTWRAVLDVNLTGTFLVCREAVSVMRSGGGGSLVLIASAAALVGWERLNSYSASKGGVVALTRAIAVDCGPAGIRVNCICPGAVETAMTADVLRHSRPRGLLVDRIGRPEDIAALAVYLGSPLADYITGAVFSADGGSSAH
jgi:NAD(P)-dependent dehydrogenase (short-subunit alcohol dehydrogenase family)